MRNYVCGWMIWLCLIGWTGTVGAATIFSFNGVGDPVRRIDIQARGMGGAGRALIDAGSFGQGNFSSANPALLAAFRGPALSTLYFVQRRTLNDGQRTHAVSDGDLGAFKLALPLKPGTVFGIGLEPITDLDFGLVDSVGTGALRHRLSIDGTGGIQAVTVGFGQRIGQKFYLGARLDLIILGTITETWAKDFDSQVIVDAEGADGRFVDTFSGEILGSSVTRLDSEDRIVRTHRGVLPAFGAVYAPNDRWRVGLALQIERTIKQTRHLRNFWAERGFEDEVVSEIDLKLPFSFGGGIAYSTGYKWMAALDVERTQWARTGSGRHNTLELAAGALYRMGQADPLSRSKRLEWMTGIHYRSLYFPTSVSQISEVGVSLGIGVPFRGRAGKFRYVIEFGKRGDVDQHGFSERFISQTFSFSGWLN